MKTYLDCIPCFMNQALKVLDLTEQDNKKKQEKLKQIMKKIIVLDFDKKPPEFARSIYDYIYEETGNYDPFKEIKERDNNNALSLVPKMEKLIDESDDSLLTAVKIAIAGNIMDFAIVSDYDIKNNIKRVLEQNFAIDNYEKLKKDIKKAKSITYLADNAGEIVFDRLLLKEIRRINSCEIRFFIKGKPIVNDATEKDFFAAEIDKISNIRLEKIHNGFPNTGLVRESREFVNLLNDSYLVISKGQGNYESLSEVDANIYFLLIAKCPVIARDLNVKKGDIICKCNSKGGS